MPFGVLLREMSSCSNSRPEPARLGTRSFCAALGLGPCVAAIGAPASGSPESKWAGSAAASQGKPSVDDQTCRNKNAHVLMKTRTRSDVLLLLLLLLLLMPLLLWLLLLV